MTLLSQKPRVNDLYLSDDYLRRNPTLHGEDSSYKCAKITPLIKKIFDHPNNLQKQIILLDAGGGAGKILNTVARFIQDSYGREVRKVALDMSLAALKVQVRNNLDIYKALNEDIAETSLKTKEVDIALLIDVLEHCPHPYKALRELSRISKYVILKVPIENYLVEHVNSSLGIGSTRQYMREKYGHINYYDARKLLRQVKENCGEIRFYSFINLRWEASERRGHKPSRTDYFSNIAFKISPKLQSCLLGSSMIILVNCAEDEVALPTVKSKVVLGKRDTAL